MTPPTRGLGASSARQVAGSTPVPVTDNVLQGLQDAKTNLLHHYLW